jgi:hypothetical protein
MPGSESIVIVRMTASIINDSLCPFFLLHLVMLVLERLHLTVTSCPTATVSNNEKKSIGETKSTLFSISYSESLEETITYATYSNSLAAVCTSL